MAAISAGAISMATLAAAIQGTFIFTTWDTLEITIRGTSLAITPIISPIGTTGIICTIAMVFIAIGAMALWAGDITTISRMVLPRLHTLPPQHRHAIASARNIWTMAACASSIAAPMKARLANPHPNLAAETGS
jgi:hypothetical protein